MEQHREHSTSVPSEDQRFDQTERDLMEAFQILARKKTPERISVAEITKTAGVARSTFYNHYVDMPSLIRAAEAKIVDELYEMLRSFRPGEGDAPREKDMLSLRFYTELCRYIQKNGFLIRMLVSPLAAEFVEQALSMFHRYVSTTVEESKRSTAEQTALSNAMSYSIGGVVGVLHRWALDGCKEPPEEIAQALSVLFLDGMRPFL